MDPILMRFCVSGTFRVKGEFSIIGLQSYFRFGLTEPDKGTHGVDPGASNDVQTSAQIGWFGLADDLLIGRSRSVHALWSIPAVPEPPPPWSQLEPRKSRARRSRCVPSSTVCSAS